MTWRPQFLENGLADFRDMTRILRTAEAFERTISRYAFTPERLEGFLAEDLRSAILVKEGSLLGTIDAVLRPGADTKHPSLIDYEFDITINSQGTRRRTTRGTNAERTVTFIHECVHGIYRAASDTGPKTPQYRMLEEAIEMTAKHFCSKHRHAAHKAYSHAVLHREQICSRPTMQLALFSDANSAKPF